jgi:hypothetical protein
MSENHLKQHRGFAKNDSDRQWQAGLGDRHWQPSARGAGLLIAVRRLQREGSGTLDGAAADDMPRAADGVG